MRPLVRRLTVVLLLVSFFKAQIGQYIVRRQITMTALVESWNLMIGI